MGIKRIKKWIAWLLTAAMLIGLPAPAAFAATQADAKTALGRLFGYYQTQRGGELTGWEDLAAAYLAGEDLTKYSLPPTLMGAHSASLLVALMKGDSANANALAEAVAKRLQSASYTYGDALELIAMTSYNRAVEASPGVYAKIACDESAAIDHLLAARESDGGFGFGSGGDPDTTGLALAALAPFNTEARPDVKAAVSGALAYLHGAQQNNGGFESAWSGNNANSAAVVLWGLCALGENLDEWTVNGKTPLDALLSFQTAQGGFGVTNASADDPFATPQAALALAQIKSGDTFFTDLGANAVLHKSLTVGVVDASGGCHERSVTVKTRDALSHAIARALRASNAVNANDYYCYDENGGDFSGGSPTGLADGAKLLAISKAVENVAYFKTKDADGIGINAIELPLGASARLTLMITSAGALTAPTPLAGIHVTDGAGNPKGVTDENGKITVGFNDAGVHSLIASLGGAFGGGAVVLPAKITVLGADTQTAKVSVRVEGVSDNIVFKPALTVGNSGGKILTVLDAVRDALDAEKIPYIVRSDGYILSIDGVAAGAGGVGNDGNGWDGWGYVIAADHLKNGGFPTGMASQPIADGDEIVVYYGNYYYTTLFPSISFAQTADGAVALTVKAWQTDWSKGGETLLSPVPGVRVSWAEYTPFAFAGVTDESGTLAIPAAKAPAGSHTLRIEKTGDYGLPDIVRLAPGYTVNVTRDGVSPSPPPSAATDEVYIKVTGPSGTMFARRGFPWYRGVTPLDLLKKTELVHETDAARKYVNSIGGVAEFAYGPNSGWLYKVNGIETIKESAAEYRLNAGDELEWFYTRDYTREAGSSAWSAAPAAPAAGGGSSAAVTLRPEAESVGGTAAVTLRDEDVKKAVAEALRDKADEIVIAPAVKGEAHKVSVELSAASVRAVAEEANAKLTLRTALGDLRVAGRGLAALAKEGKGTVTLSIEREADVVSALIALDGKAVDRVEGGVKLRVPLAGKPSAGTVALRVREDGTEEVILLSAVRSGALAVVLDGSARIRIADRGRSFDDVGESAWFGDDADFVSARELFRGTDENAFSGDLPMTRAMLTAVFHRLAGAPAAEGNAFPDVADAAWYREAAAWASAAGVIRGVDGDFAGAAEITREQLAAMAMRFAASEGLAMGEPAELTGFADRASVSAWADESVKWAVGAGLLTGDAAGRLNAGGPATRAETAAILRRFVESWTEIL
ncbi:MAG: S-layer homology domain-containing protein [Clostridiales Family XIII bacterium]|nr:S-layer homology domain-containing protein [Clostridiales Family XIII bacterium]